jgi:precorrin-6A/cobalt-precorrin-6A reductase
VTVLRVLILGGTSEARHLAGALALQTQVEVISSLAGRVAAPLLPAGQVRIGGFGGADGLAAWLSAHEVSAVIDATHPFAATIGRSAAVATRHVGIPLLALRRPGWTEHAGDDWRRVSSMAHAAAALSGLGERVFLTTGRKEVATFAGMDEHWFLIRSVDLPDEPLPSRHELVLARGPFAIEDEIALMQDHEIDVLVTKDSGGGMTSAKLDAARELRLPVVMIDRPGQLDVPWVHTVDAAAAWVRDLPH